MTTLLSGTGIGLSRGNRQVLDDVDVSVAPGEVLALVGPNGAGKSTLLAVLAGTLRPDAGTVLLGNEPLNGLSAKQQARRRAVLEQEHLAGFGYTCQQIVEMGRYPWNGTEHNADDEDAVAEAMECCAVTEFARRPFRALSGGERARVALARVFAQRTGLLLLDEPTAAMDLRYQELVMALVRERAGGNAHGGRVDVGKVDGASTPGGGLGGAHETGGPRVGAIVVLHDLNLAAAYADRIMILREGRVAADGPPDRVLTADLVSEVYGLPVRRIDGGGHPLITPDRPRQG